MERSLKLLIVDDDPSVCDWLALFADRLGYEVEVMESGEEAVACFESNRPDVVTLDMLLPGIDGIETLKALMSLPGPRRGRVPRWRDSRAFRSSPVSGCAGEGFRVGERARSSHSSVGNAAGRHR